MNAKKTITLVLSVFTIAGIILLAISALLANHTHNFIQHANKTEGIVAENVLTGTSQQRLQNSRNTNSAVQYSTVQNLYSAKVQFTDEQGQTYTFLEGQQSNPPAHVIGERVPVYYDSNHPEHAKIASFFDLWFGSLLCAGMGLFFLLSGLIPYTIIKKRATMREQLRHTGMPVESTFSEVIQDTGVRVNGRSPYKIVSLHSDPANGKASQYYSKALWFNPSEFINAGQKIMVFVDRGNPKRYAMDIEFLPTVN